MPFLAKIVLDSISEEGVRLTTFELTYPLIVHNELLTHRAQSKSDDLWLEFSRNSSSNRALAPGKLLQQVIDDPYIPTFLKATKGMIGGEPLSDYDQDISVYGWLKARDEAVKWFNYYDTLPTRIHKQHRNRLLGPFQWITTVVTAVDEMWEHFFGLRDHPAAQPDIAHVAKMAHELYVDNQPTVVGLGGWHLPYLVWEDWLIASTTLEQALAVSVARCARSSYLRQGEMVTIRDDLQLYNDLKSADPPHASPMEHQAQATDKQVRSGNYIGWLQYRKILGL